MYCTDCCVDAVCMAAVLSQGPRWCFLPPVSFVWLSGSSGIAKLGPHVGQVTSNESAIQDLFDYSIIPGRALVAKDLRDGPIRTRQGGMLNVIHVG